MRKHLLWLTTVSAYVCLHAAYGLAGRADATASLAAGASGVATCTPPQLSLGTDDENGNFDGMSHSGTLLVLRNLGPSACRFATVPVITLYAKDTLLDVKFTPVTAPGTHTSVIVAAGAELTSGLRWVSGDVYDPGVCVTATSLHVKVAGQDLSTSISHQLCGQKGKTIQAEMTLLATDPVYRPGQPGEPGS